MTVGRLKAMLEEYDDDKEIVFQPTNSIYGEIIGGIEEDSGVAAFYGKDFKALVLESYGQCRTICSEDNLDLEEGE